MTARDILAQNVRRLYRLRGLTQQQLAQKAGLSYATINEIMNCGDRNVTVRSLGQISAVLGVSTYELLKPAEGAESIEFRTESERFWRSFARDVERFHGPEACKDSDFVKSKFESYFKFVFNGHDELKQQVWNDGAYYGLPI